MGALSQLVLSRPPGCKCGGAWADARGNITLLTTCPICTNAALDGMRGAEYAIAYTNSGDTQKALLLRQKEFFRA